MDEWAWDQLRPWLEARVSFPVGPPFCVMNGPTSGGPWSNSQVRIALRRTAAQPGVRRRFAPHQLRHAHAVEIAREGVPLNVIQRQLGHANLGVIHAEGVANQDRLGSPGSNRDRHWPIGTARSGERAFRRSWASRESKICRRCSRRDRKVRRRTAPLWSSPAGCGATRSGRASRRRPLPTLS